MRVNTSLGLYCHARKGDPSLQIKNFPSHSSVCKRPNTEIKTLDKPNPISCWLDEGLQVFLEQKLEHAEAVTDHESPHSQQLVLYYPDTVLAVLFPFICHKFTSGNFLIK